MRFHFKFLFLFSLASPLFLGGAEGEISKEPVWDSHQKGGWGADFELVSIPAPDGEIQPAYVHWAKSDQPRPALVSLHTWSGDYKQTDPLADLAVKENWNYIHPHFRGPNKNPKACLSPGVIDDIDGAAGFLIRDRRVDPKNVFLVGVSGGGYAACGMFMKGRSNFRKIMAWVPITDLEAWFQESSPHPSRKHYAEDILASVGKAGESLNLDEAHSRSPMKMAFPSPISNTLEIYAGIHDGWSGSVPVSHSIRFYNRNADHTGNQGLKVTEEESSSLCQRTYRPAQPLGNLEGKEILFQRGFREATVTIFEGGHEMLSRFCFERMKSFLNSIEFTNR